MSGGWGRVVSLVLLLGMCGQVWAEVGGQRVMEMRGGEGSSAIITIRSTMQQTLAVQVRIFALVDSLEGQEQAILVEGRASAGLIAAPSRFLLAPGRERKIEIFNRWPASKPENYALEFDAVLLGASGRESSGYVLDVGFPAPSGKLRVRVMPQLPEGVPAPQSTPANQGMR